MVEPSSEDLHPRYGARFLMTRIGPDQPDLAQSALDYRVEVYVAQGQTFQGTLRLSPAPAQDLELRGIPQDHWCYHEAQKLARVLRKSQPASLLRWRPEPQTS